MHHGRALCMKNMGNKDRRIQLSDHFTYGRLMRFTLPSILIMIFTSVYGVIDGLFISNYAGKTAFAAINLIIPPFIILGALGFMIGTGGTAVVARTLGEGDRERANRYFSMLVYAAAIGGAVIVLIAAPLLPAAARGLGAEGQMLADCVTYGRVVLAAMPFFMLENVFQAFFVAAEKPKLGLAVSVGAGLVNIGLDALLVAVLRRGMWGAAIATSISQAAGGLIPVWYFARRNDSLLRLGRTRCYGRVLLETCFNGLSEMVGSASASLVAMLYNFQMMRLAGENGIAAYGVVGYVSFVFAAIFIGYAQGSAPVVSFHYGAQNPPELKNLLRRSAVLMAAAGATMTLLSLALAGLIADIFVGYDLGLRAMTARGMRINAFSFLFCGFNIFGSSFFTALGNGRISAAISFLRTFLFESACVLILPYLLGLDGVWFAIIPAELFALAITLLFLVRSREKYGYL